MSEDTHDIQLQALELYNQLTERLEDVRLYFSKERTDSYTTAQVQILAKAYNEDISWVTDEARERGFQVDIDQNMLLINIV